MDRTTLAAVARRFPLLGRPRLACPSLPERVQEIADIAHVAGQGGTGELTEAAHALNKAALLASDCGLPDLARELCWQHIDVYRAADRPLTVREARHMLEPALNLARLHIRAGNSNRALRQLTSTHHASLIGADLIIDGHLLPLGSLTGSLYEHHKLREWTWLHLLSDGVRALARTGRWDDAVAHARAHRGIGLHLLEGRQAAIVAHCLNDAPAAARAALDESTLEHPWERQVASCLNVMCGTPKTPTRPDVATMVQRYVEHQPMPGHVAFRVQLGLTVTTLAHPIDPKTANEVLAHVADEAIAARDGYAARDLIGFDDTDTANLTGTQRHALSDLLTASGLDAATLSQPHLHSLERSTRAAAEALRCALR